MNFVPKPNETQGARLKRAREERGLHQTFVAEKAETTGPVLSRIENNRQYPSDKLLERLAAIYKIPFFDLKIPRLNKKKFQILTLEELLLSKKYLKQFLAYDVDERVIGWATDNLTTILDTLKRKAQ